MPATTQPPPLSRPAIYRAFPGLIAAESKRHGGVSPPPYTSLNLGFHTADCDEHITENRRRFLTALNIPQDRLASSLVPKTRLLLTLLYRRRYPRHRRCERWERRHHSWFQW